MTLANAAAEVALEWAAEGRARALEEPTEGERGEFWAEAERRRAALEDPTPPS